MVNRRLLLVRRNSSVSPNDLSGEVMIVILLDRIYREGEGYRRRIHRESKYLCKCIFYVANKVCLNGTLFQNRTFGIENATVITTAMYEV